MAVVGKVMGLDLRTGCGCWLGPLIDWPVEPGGLRRFGCPWGRCDPDFQKAPGLADGRFAQVAPAVAETSATRIRSPCFIGFSRRSFVSAHNPHFSDVSHPAHSALAGGRGVALDSH